MRTSLFFFFHHVDEKEVNSKIEALGFVVSYAGCFGQVPKWPKGADCKSVAIGFQGSNPCLPTISGLCDLEV